MASPHALAAIVAALAVLLFCSIHVDAKRVYNDVESCGHRHVKCPVRAHSYRTCKYGQCGFKCKPGSWRDCDYSKGNGCETDVSCDPRNCGRCGKRCMAPCANSRAVCDHGECRFVCNRGFTLYNDHCVAKRPPPPHLPLDSFLSSPPPPPSQSPPPPPSQSPPPPSQSPPPPPSQSPPPPPSQSPPPPPSQSPPPPPSQSPPPPPSQSPPPPPSQSPPPPPSQSPPPPPSQSPPPPPSQSPPPPPHPRPPAQLKCPPPPPHRYE